MKISINNNYIQESNTMSNYVTLQFYEIAK